MLLLAFYPISKVRYCVLMQLMTLLIHVNWRGVHLTNLPNRGIFALFYLLVFAQDDHPSIVNQFIMLCGDGIGRGSITTAPVVDGLQRLICIPEIAGDFGSGMTAPA